MAGRLLAAASVVAVFGAHGAARAANLAKGIYTVSSYYVSSTASGGGSCVFAAHTSLVSEYTYPGPSKPGAVARTFINASGSQYVLVGDYPTTPANGATSWSGNLTLTFLPGGTPTTGTFNATISVIDADSFISSFTSVVPSGSGTCTSVIQEVGILVGK